MRRSIRILLPLLVDSGESVRVLRFRFREKIQSGCLAFLVGGMPGHVADDETLINEVL